MELQHKLTFVQKNKNLLEPHRLKSGDQKLLMQIKGKRRVRVCTVRTFLNI
jgi:hypothetical protein